MKELGYAPMKPGIKIWSYKAGKWDMVLLSRKLGYGPLKPEIGIWSFKAGN